MPAEAHYRQLLDLSRRMLIAGMAQQWDELVLLEQQRRTLLFSAPGVSPRDAPQPLIELIQQIQDCDTQLREKLDAWMSHARILLRMDTPAAQKP